MAHYSMATHAVGKHAMEKTHVQAPIQGTPADHVDMQRMHKPQELNVSSSGMSQEVCNRGTDPRKRIYTAITLVGYSVIVGLTWPFSLV